MIMFYPQWLRPIFRRLARDTSAVAIVEFALSLPIVVTMSMYGAEAANLAYSSQKIGDLATLTADSVSRIRIAITESDVTDALSGVKILGDGLAFRNNGRIIVSSVQPIVNGSGVVTDQKIRWQRCTGVLARTSAYGAQSALLGVTGIGPTGRKIAVNADAELIFVEIYYTYKPLISNAFYGARTLSAVVAMDVRERSANDLQSGGTASSCSTYAA